MPNKEGTTTGKVDDNDDQSQSEHVCELDPKNSEDSEKGFFITVKYRKEGDDTNVGHRFNDSRTFIVNRHRQRLSGIVDTDQTITIHDFTHISKVAKPFDTVDN